MTARLKALGGFTLIELMVTLAIASILMLIAVPSFETYRRNAELTSATNTLLATINAARGEAMKRGMSAMVVPTNNGNNWNAGWIVFVDTDRSQNFNSTLDTLVFTQAAMPNYMTIAANGTAGLATAPYILFDASGYSKTKAGGFGALALTLNRTDVTGTSLLEQTRRVVISSTGRARTCRPVSTTDSTCAASSSQ